MYNVLFFLTIALFTSSCIGGEDESTSNESLLDIGFLEEKSREFSDKVDAMDIFKSNSGKHYGIDVSHWQGNILKDLSKRDSLRFIICKATEGDYYVDPDFRNNWNEIKARGLIRGTYHFYMCADDPLDQANHFTTTIADITSTDIAPILDIEQGSMTPDVSGDQMVKDILIFLKAVEHKLNRKPIIYTDYIFAQQYFKNPELSKYDLWLAEWESEVSPRLPDVWEKKGYKIWQKSASYDAYSKVLDLDEYSGLLRDIVD
ncbi:glycoside hydrolase family 25 protein [Reichenbachiella sp.]|uniref:glycoside hydrolase family 25 protein n=1 Tax=Reichenbachiella sp. TaxID=2184521 RepID=UPI003BAE3088